MLCYHKFFYKTLSIKRVGSKLNWLKSDWEPLESDSDPLFSHVLRNLILNQTEVFRLRTESGRGLAYDEFWSHSGLQQAPKPVSTKIK